MTTAAKTSPEEDLAWLLAAQDGVITRQQVLQCGLGSALVRSNLRLRQWVAVAPGVYITHTGPLTWRQRAWCAVLGAPRAALSHGSALPSAARDDGPIHIVVGPNTKAVRRPGVVVHRRTQVQERVNWQAQPPRVRIEQAVLDVAASAAREIDTIAALADAVGARWTTGQRLQSALAQRPRCRRRKLIAAVLADIVGGTHSVLEHAYLTRVERPHGLPRPRRQTKTTVGRHGFRDAEFDQLGTLIELDGRPAHDNVRARDRDLERDLDAEADADQRTTRLGWGQVYLRPCQTAAKVARILQRRGWTGEFKPCPKCPPELR